MNTKTSDRSPLKALLIEQLKDILWAEKQLVKALARSAKAATHPELSKALESHRGETRRHIERILKAFELLGVAARSKKCAAMEGLLEEAQGIQEEFAGSPALDAALICAAQKMEHYELATYGSLRAHAKALGLNPLVELFGLTLEEEQQADRRLSEIAVRTVNPAAARSLPKP